MPSDLQITNIKDQANANSAITIASDGQITVNQNNPTITLGTNTTFPAGHVIQTITDTHAPSSATTITVNVSNDYLGSDLQCTITPKSNGNKLVITAFIPDVFNNSAAGRAIAAGFAYDANFSSGNGTTIGTRAEIASYHVYDYSGHSVISNLEYSTSVIVGTNAPSAGSASIIRPIFVASTGDCQINTNAGSKDVCFMMVQEIQQ